MARLSIDRCSAPCVLLLGAWFALLTGCGERAPFPIAPVTGRVTLGSRPLPAGEGSVVFVCTAGRPGQVAVGPLAADGTFRLRTSEFDGAAVGEHRAMVHYRRSATPEEKRNLVVTPLLIPEKYAREDQTPLRYKVADGPNHFDIDLN
jgi:hypothetical protein